jgi:hypothetical protein
MAACGIRRHFDSSRSRNGLARNNWSLSENNGSRNFDYNEQRRRPNIKRLDAYIIAGDFGRCGNIADRRSTCIRHAFIQRLFFCPPSGSAELRLSTSVGGFPSNPGSYWKRHRNRDARAVRSDAGAARLRQLLFHPFSEAKNSSLCHFYGVHIGRVGIRHVVGVNWITRFDYQSE